MNRCWFFFFQKNNFFEEVVRASVCFSLYLCLPIACALPFLSLVFIRVQFRFYRSSCVPKLFATHLSLSLSPFQTKISPLQLVFVNFPTDIVTPFIPSFDSMSSCRSGVSTGYPPVFQIWTECEIKETKPKRNRLNRWFTPFFRFVPFSSFPPASIVS